MFKDRSIDSSIEHKNETPTAREKYIISSVTS